MLWDNYYDERCTKSGKILSEFETMSSVTSKLYHSRSCSRRETASAGSRAENCSSLQVGKMKTTKSRHRREIEEAEFVLVLS